MSTSEMGLAIGLGAVFLALLLGVAALVVIRDERAMTARSATLIARFGTIGRRESIKPFTSRVLGPLWAAAARLARMLSGRGVTAGLTRRLDLAGNPPQWTIERLLGCKGAGTVVLGLFGAMLGKGSLPQLVVFAALAGAAGFFLPDLLLYNTAIKRQQQIQQELPDSVDLLVISIQAGLGFDAAIAQLTKNTSGPLAGEFVRVLQEMQIGKSRREAFQALADRVAAPDVRHFVGAILQADTLGVSISGVLAEQAVQMRARRRQRAEEQAQKVPVKILFPLIFFVLPALLIVILGPAIIQILKAF
jgi:tight adherence protein C